MSKLDFYPLLSPREVIERGAFGGSYFGEENLSGDTQYCHLFKYHFDGLDRGLYEGEKYSPKKNKYKVKARNTVEAIKKAAKMAGLKGNDWIATQTNYLKKIG